MVAVKPFIMKDCTLTVAADNYEAHVSQVQFDPSSSVVTFKGLTPEAAFSFGSSPTWTCTLAFAQDWTTADSLSRYLFDHSGEEVEVVFEPIAGGPSITATLIIQPGAIGGQVDAVAVSSVTLGVQGKPQLAPIGGSPD